MVIDGQEMPFSLFDLVMDTLKNSPSTNSLIAYRDNARAIKGSTIKQLRTTDPTTASQVEPVEKEFALTFTAETHNFPTGIAPFPGAETGTGGRLRDTHCVGRGALIIAGTAGYSVGNLNIPNYPLPWEDSSWSYPSNMAKYVCDTVFVAAITNVKISDLYKSRLKPATEPVITATSLASQLSSVSLVH